MTTKTKANDAAVMAAAGIAIETTSNGTQAVEAPSKEYFVGDYVHVMRDIVITALVGNLNVMFIGKPGTGKTDVSVSILDEIYGRDGYGYVEIEPTKPTDEVKGSYHFGKMVNDYELERVPKNTISDIENIEAMVIDEIGRASDHMWDLLMFKVHPRDNEDHRTAIGTANTMPSGERQSALVNRMALWYWCIPVGVSAADVAMVKMRNKGKASRLSVPGDIPTKERIDAARNAIPGEKAMQVVHGLIAQLEAEALKKMGVEFDNRTTTQLMNLLFHGSAYFSGDSNFGRIPPEVRNVLKYCWPALDSADQVLWQQVVDSCGGLDVVVDRILGEMAVKANELAAITSDVDRGNQGEYLIEFAQTKQRELNALSKTASEGEKALIKAAKKSMKLWVANATRGVPVK